MSAYLIIWFANYLCVLSYGHSFAYPDNKIHGAHMGPIWVLSAPGGPHVGVLNIAIWVCLMQIEW